MTDGPLLKLLAWLSPSFPVGAYAYSHGLEYAVESGLLTDRPGVAGWVEALVRHGTGRVDAGLLLAAHRAVVARDWPALAEAAELAAAMRGTAELALESTAQGRAFVDTIRACWPHPLLTEAVAAVDGGSGRPTAYSVAVGIAAAAHGVGERSTLAAYLHAFAANLVSAAVRLVPLGQTDGQRIVAGLEPVILAAVDAALVRAPEDLGAAAPMADWVSMRHEEQYTRLFRS